MRPLLARYPEHLVVDAGGWAERTNPDRPELRSRLLLEGLHDLGMGVVNVSARDLALGPEALRACEDSLGLQLLSANIEVGGRPWFRPYVLLRRNLGGRDLGIAITGITADGHVPDGAWPDSLRPVVADPVECAKRMLDVLAPQSDVQVLLAFLPAADLDRLAGQLPGYDLLVGSTGDLRDAPHPGPAPVVLASGTKCKQLGWVALRPGANDVVVVTAAGVEPLDARVPDDAEMLRRVRAFKTRLGEGLPATAAVAPNGAAAGPGGSGGGLHP